jgi:tetraprenyl-beta-curcumene synthase
MTVSLGNKVRLTAAFPSAARCYWCSIFPYVRSEIRYWRKRAKKIPDPALRALALETQHAKRGNVEGAVAFATFVPRTYRTVVVRVITAYQVAFDYLDTLAEQPVADPIANGRQLNQALLAAVEPALGRSDYYAHHPRDDGGYLEALVDTCVAALERLPAYTMVVEAAWRASARIVSYQTYNHGDASGSHRAFDEWSQRELDAYDTIQPGSGLRRWELSAATGSSLPLFALIAAASDIKFTQRDVDAIECAYYPWLGAVNSLLDSLVDLDEDMAPGQNRLFDYYDSSEEAIKRLVLIVRRAACEAELLPRGHQDRLILAAMVSFYLSLPEVFNAEASKQIRKALGHLAVPMMWVFGARRLLGRVMGRRLKHNSYDINS